MKTCDCPVMDYPRCYRIQIFAARREYVCCECGAVIRIGQRYEYASGIWNNKFAVFKTCLTCCNIRQDYCAAFGELRERVVECTGVDYVTGERT